MADPTCPICGSTEVVPIVYGYTKASPVYDLEKMMPNFVLGGCCITDFSPTLHCNICGEEFGNIRGYDDSTLDSLLSRLKKSAHLKD